MVSTRSSSRGLANQPDYPSFRIDDEDWDQDPDPGRDVISIDSDDDADKTESVSSTMQPSSPAATRSASQAAMAAANSPDKPAPHRQFDKVCTKNAKCDRCEGRNVSVMQKCRTCGMTTCRACHDAGRFDVRHDLTGLALDWEPPARAPRGSKRGRGSSARSATFGGVAGATARRGRPTRRPQDNYGRGAARRGLVRELPTHNNYNNGGRRRGSAASGGSVDDESDRQRINIKEEPMEDHDTEYTVTASSPAHQGTAENQIRMVDDEQWGEDGAGDGHSKGARRGMPTYGQEDAIYARPKTIEDDLRDRVDTHAAADPALRGSSQAISTRPGRTALPSTRPQVSPPGSLGLTRPLRCRSESEHGAGGDHHALGVLHDLSQKSTASIQRRGNPPPQHGSGARQSTRAYYDSPAHDSLRRLAIEATAHQKHIEGRQPYSSAVVTQHEMHTEPRSYPNTWDYHQRSAAAQAPGPAYPSYPTYDVGGYYRGGPAVSHGGYNVVANPPQPSLNESRLNAGGIAPTPTISTHAYPGRPQLEGYDEQRSLTSQLEENWRSNPIIQNERDANGDLAALNMLEAGAILVSIRHGVPSGELNLWFDGMRSGLREDR